MDYSPLEKIAKQLEEQVSTLKSGQMNASELHSLVKKAREVYERLVILEFQWAEKPKQKSAPAPLVTPFKINTESAVESDPETKTENQESTDEVKESAEAEIEEKVTKESEQEIAEEAAPAEIKAEAPVEEVPETEVKLEPVEKKVEKAAEKPEPEVKQEEKKEEEEPQVKVSEEASSIAEKYEQAPIEDIAKAISLNEKFQFIRVLCANDSKSFESLLSELNSSQNTEQALSTFATLIPTPEAEDELAIYEKFQDLIKRRF